MFKVQGIDHVELFVPDRFEAAAWYQRILGFEIIPEFRFWADDPGGPLMVSGADGVTKLALFEGPISGSQDAAGFRRVAFRTTALGLLEFLRRLPEWNPGVASMPGAAVDHEKAYSVYFSDPYGHQLEVTTYEYDEFEAAFAEHGHDTP
jgi:catechol 2,3-dioxygenase-like lactoylglutathione lyase family enzyme